ncbi:MAG: hypothetical protein ACW99U_06385 [Candidatus Thorarchaeota archaeon]
MEKLGIPLDSVEVPKTQVARLVPRQLDRVLGNVLIPRQISLIHGPERSPLTVLSHVVAFSGARWGGHSVFLDSGKRFNVEIARRYGSFETDVEGVLSRVHLADVMSLASIETLSESLASIEGLTVVVLDNLVQLLRLSAPPGTKKRQRRLFEAFEVLRNLVNSLDVHLLLVGLSSHNWKTGEVHVTGGNVVAHDVDSLLRVETINKTKNHVHILVERSPVVGTSTGVVVKVGPMGVKSLRSRG